MASTSETGHARNIASFEALLTACTAFGPAYQPSNPDLQLPTLRQKLEESRLMLAKVKEEGSVWTRTVGERQAVFTPLKSLTTRIVNAVGSSGAPAETLRKAQSVQRKINGRRAAAPMSSPAAEVSDTPVKKSRSVSQQSFTLLTDHFHELLSFLATEPKYQPKEPELQLTTLQNHLATLQQCCTMVQQHDTNLQNARRNRDQVMYADQYGICDRAQTVKAYVKSVFGTTSPEFLQVSKLKFSNVSR